ncbi:MAG: DnaJ C-terminal domain-containing protein [bacterium]
MENNPILAFYLQHLVLQSVDKLGYFRTISTFTSKTSFNMDFKDYYSVLGLTKSAKPDEIKKAYRSLAQQYHPDKNPGDSKSEERFKEINEAYQVLSDPQNREKYDRLGSSWNSHSNQAGSGSPFDWQAWQSPGGMHTDFSQFSGGSGFSDFFETIFNGRSTGRSHRTTQPASELQATITFSQAYHGCTLKLTTGGKQREIKLKPGIKDGQTINIPSGQGHDIHVKVHVKPDDVYRLNGSDLEADLEVPLYTALLGGQVNFKSMKGTVAVKIAPETKPGTKLRLKGFGMPLHGKDQEFGDLMLIVDIELPTHLSEEEKVLISSLAALRA